VVALALLHELSGIYRRAYGTAQVLQNASAQRGTRKTRWKVICAPWGCRAT
jgi:hypothetical protein